jgi:O-antigen ligase
VRQNALAVGRLIPGADRRGMMSGAAGFGLLVALGLALGVGLSLRPVSAPLLVGAGASLVALLLLAIVRYDLAVAVGVLLLPIVRVEPAPVDGVFAIIIALAAVTGRIELRRLPLSMAVLAGSFISLYTISAMNAIDGRRAAQWLSVTIYLVAFAAWVCCYVDRESRTRVLLRLYLFVAVAWGLLASVALFFSFPGSATLTIEGQRAVGLFKDPNVFGPFLVPAALLLVQESLSPRLLRLNRLAKALCFAALVAGILFSYSRAAWLNLVVGIIVMTIVFSLRRGGGRRALALVAVVVVALGALGWTIAVSHSIGFLEQRARFQSYDTQRFSAQRTGLELAQTHLLGVGPGQFEAYSAVSAHSTYVRSLAEQGVVGAVLLLALLFGTLLLAARNAVLGRDTHGLGSTALLAAWCGLLVNSIVVDTIHWRHLWLLAGLIWAGAMTDQVSSSTGDRAVM